MSHKDYKLIAAALASVQVDRDDDIEYKQWERDCCAIARALASDSPRFDRELFLSACGL
jgi:hypothetical protein